MIRGVLPSAETYPAGSYAGRVELMGSRTSALHHAYGRLVIIQIFFTLAYLALVIRGFDLMVIQGFLNGFQDLGDRAAVQAQPHTSLPVRDIVDRNGTLMATSIKTVSLYADPHVMTDPAQTSTALAQIFKDQNSADILKKLDPSKRFVWIARNLSPDQQTAVLDIGDPGLAFENETRRLYPQGPLAAHVVGYSGIDGQGLAGLERGASDLLQKNSSPLMLTIDMRMQHILRAELQKTIHDFTASAGAGVIMDVTSGDVMALVSLPDFDPHEAGSASDAQKFNRATLGTYELGSTFKIFTTAALLEQQNTPLATTFDTRNPIRVGRFTISDYHPENRPQTIPEVFMHSSNIGTAMMAEKIGTKGLKEFFGDLGLLAPMSFDLPEVGTPQIPTPWRDISTLTASYGHGIAVTPLHMAAAAATLIGDGRMVVPHLIKTNGEPIKKGDRIVSKETTRTMRALMRLVVRHGTGSKADVPGLMMGGKTGTAEKSIHGRYIKNALMSSFVAAFPMNDPRYLIFISVDDPKPNKTSFGYATAGWTAAPAAARVATRMATLIGIPRDTAAVDPSDDMLPYLADYKPEPQQEDVATLPVTLAPSAAAIPSITAASAVAAASSSPHMIKGETP